jgi:tetratricopeptide (TPR) repeat protein
MKRFAVLASAAAALALALSCASAPAKVAAPAPVPAALPATPAAAPASEISAALKPYAAATQAGRAALEKAATLSSQGKWKSAYQALEDFDAADADPFALAMKTSIFLLGAVRSDMNLSFSLVDLEEGQDVETLRNEEGDYTLMDFDPQALADAQAAKGVAAPGILSKELGDYYYDVFARFAGQWAMSDEDILGRIAENYGKAYGAGIFDAASLSNHAETLVRLNRGDDSLPIFRKAIELDPKSAKLLYGYAVSLAFSGKKAEALAELDEAIAAYGDDSDKVGAIALGAKTASELGDDARAQGYFALADAAFPESPTPGVVRHMVAVETGRKGEAILAADGLIAAYGSNPNVVRSLISTWYSAGEAATAREFLERSIAKGGGDMTVATLDFYLAVLLSQDSPSAEDRAAALAALDGAESRFQAALGPDNEVYGIIAEIRASLQSPAPADGSDR